jgi:hypothetical protein
VSRREAATILGVSITSVRRLEDNELHAHVADDGSHHFDEREVRELAARLGHRPAPELPASGESSEPPPATPQSTLPVSDSDRLAILERRVQQLGQGLRLLGEAVQEHEASPHGPVCSRCGGSVLLVCALCDLLP